MMCACAFSCLFKFIKCDVNGHEVVQLHLFTLSFLFPSFQRRASTTSTSRMARVPLAKETRNTSLMWPLQWTKMFSSRSSTVSNSYASIFPKGRLTRIELNGNGSNKFVLIFDKVDLFKSLFTRDTILR